MESVIKVSHVSHNYGKKCALDDVSFEVQKGRVFGLVGENGAGKTTLIKHLLGSLCPDQGEITLFGSEPSRDPAGVLARIGYLSEDRDLPLWMRVKELMRYTRAFYADWDEDYAQQLLTKFRLSPDAKIRNLSRGEKARAGLLMALAHRPELLLLDEPSSGLDAVSRSDILGVVVRSVAEEGRTVVFSSHLLDEVERVVDDVAMFNQGHLELLMPMEELRATHQRRVVELPEGVDAFPELDCVLHIEGEGREWAVVCHGEADATRQQLEGLGARILDETTPSLNTVFIARVHANRQTTTNA
ncbi:MAG: ABC transporter ATP-binding protein [Candidatus Hydrogenedentota bacterium]|nr:MAG: ABC transporter ATP-binding protein [Candidatus Hydrogenedentota bacterium]